MDLTWLDTEHLPDEDIAGITALLEAARAIDCPHALVPTCSTVAAMLRHGWDGETPLSAVVRDARERIIGLLHVWLPNWDNRHLGWLEVTVDPVVRRRGLGRQLFTAGVERVRQDGRRLIVAGSYDGTAGVHFAKAMGLDRASEEVERRQDLTSMDWARLDLEYEDAAASAAAYELQRVAGPSPDELLPALARLTEAINDAPTDDLDLEDEVFEPERVRGYEAAQLARGDRLYRVLARERTTGALAGHTVVAVDSERPWHGAQHDTSVTREHRGHRLGLLLKIEMLRWLAGAEPQLRTLDTSNATSNAHMIRVNEALGYRVVATAIHWQRHL